MARKPKLDSVLAEAKTQARDALLEHEPETVVGEHLEAVAEDSRVVTHYFECTQDGYVGWRWYVTLTRPPRGKTPTVNESGLVPGDGALLAPDWVPWEERMRAYKEEQAAKREAEEAEEQTRHGAEADEGASETGDDADDAPRRAHSDMTDAEVEAEEDSAAEDATDDADVEEDLSGEAAGSARGNRAARREALQRRRRRRRRRGHRSNKKS